MQTKVNYLLRLGDNALILSQQLSQLCGKGPALEEDMALTNVALDLLGQTRRRTRTTGGACPPGPAPGRHSSWGSFFFF